MKSVLQNYIKLFIVKISLRPDFKKVVFHKDPILWTRDKVRNKSELFWLFINLLYNYVRTH